MSNQSNAVKAWNPFLTADAHRLKLEAQFSAANVDNTVTFVRVKLDAIGRIESGERARAFNAELSLSYLDKNSRLVFHDGPVETADLTANPVFIVPSTVVDGFWLRNDDHTRTVLKQSALDYGISDQLREILEPAIKSIARVAAAALSQIDLDEISLKKPPKMFARAVTEYHLDFKKLTAIWQRGFLEKARLQLHQIMYCLGRHRSSVSSDWAQAIEKHGAPVGVTLEDIDSVKWQTRLKKLQSVGLFDENQKINWARVDEVTKGGRQLHNFVAGLIRTREIGFDQLKGAYGILTPESLPEDWRINSMLRLLYYFFAAKQKSRQKKQA